MIPCAGAVGCLVPRHDDHAADLPRRLCEVVEHVQPHDLPMMVDHWNLVKAIGSHQVDDRVAVHARRKHQRIALHDFARGTREGEAPQEATPHITIGDRAGQPLLRIYNQGDLYAGLIDAFNCLLDGCGKRKNRLSKVLAEHCRSQVTPQRTTGRGSACGPARREGVRQGFSRYLARFRRPRRD